MPCLGRSDRPKVPLRRQELSTLLSGRGKLLLLRGFISMLMRLRRWAKLFSSKNSISPFLALGVNLSDLDSLCLIKVMFVFSSSFALSTSCQILSPSLYLSRLYSSGCPPRAPALLGLGGSLWRQEPGSPW